MDINRKIISYWFWPSFDAMVPTCSHGLRSIMAYNGMIGGLHQMDPNGLVSTWWVSQFVSIEK